MKNEQDQFLLIESYLNGTLTEQERIAFEKLLSENQELREAAELSKATQKAIKRKKLYEVKNLISEVHTEKSKGKFIEGLTFFGVFLVLCGLGIYLLVPSKQDTLKPDPIVVTSPAAPGYVAPVLEAQESTPVKEANKTPLKKQEPDKKSLVSITPDIKYPSDLHTTVGKSNAGPSLPEPAKKLSSAIAEPAELKKVQENACAHSFLEAHTISEPSCVNQSNGRIVVSGFKGGKAPYISKLFNSQNQVVSSSNIPAGTYSLLISDQNQCEKMINGIQVKEENCKKDYVLNATNGDVIDLGVATQTTSLTVFEKGEIVYFYKQFNEGENIQWGGISLKGTIQNGYFVLLLQYQDGTALNGSVTVFK